MEKDSILKRILEEEDFIHSPKYQNSLQKFLLKNDQILENTAIGRLLLLSADEVEKIYLESVAELKKTTKYGDTSQYCKECGKLGLDHNHD